MPIARVQLPDGRIGRFEVPEGTTPEQAQSLIQAQLPALSQPAAPQLPESLRPRTAAPDGATGVQRSQSVGAQIGQQLWNLAAGAIRGAGSIGATIIRPFESSEENAERRRQMDEVLASAGADTESLLYGAGKLGAEVAGTAGVGGALAIPVRLAARGAPFMAPVAAALSSGGMGAATTAGKIASGAVVGGAGAGLIDPEMSGAGAIAGAVVPFVPGILAKGVGKLVDLRQIPQNKAAGIARNALGPDLPEVLNALKASQGQGMSAAQATADINSPTWQALIDRATKRDPRFLSALEKSQGEVSLNALSRLAGGTTAAEARGTTEVAKKNLNTITGTMRENSLARANLGKFVADEAALREANDLATMVGSGGQLDPARFAAQATGAEKALRSVGIKPLEGAPLAQRITGVAQSPQFAGNDLIEGSVRQIANEIAKWTVNVGLIDANALEVISKNSVNDAIAKLRPGMDATSQRNAAAGVLSRIKPMIDDAIEGAGGTDWRKYLTTHTEGMRKIAEKQLTGEALKLWKTDKNAFVRLVQNESPEAVEKILGPDKYNIAVELAEDTLGTLQSIANKRLNQLAASKQATDGEKALTTLLRETTSRFRLPSWLSFWGAAANKTLSELEKAIGSRSMKVLSEAAQSPSRTANLLETLL